MLTGHYCALSDFVDGTGGGKYSALSLSLFVVAFFVMLTGHFCVLSDVDKKVQLLVSLEALYCAGKKKASHVMLTLSV